MIFCGSQVRGEHDTFVFTYQRRPIKKMNNTAWKAVGLPVNDAYLRGPHNLKHYSGPPITCGWCPRLRPEGYYLDTKAVI